MLDPNAYFKKLNHNTTPLPLSINNYPLHSKPNTHESTCQSRKKPHANPTPEHISLGAHKSALTLFIPGYYYYSCSHVLHVFFVRKNAKDTTNTCQTIFATFTLFNISTLTLDGRLSGNKGIWRSSRDAASVIQILNNTWTLLLHLLLLLGFEHP